MGYRGRLFFSIHRVNLYLLRCPIVLMVTFFKSALSCCVILFGLVEGTLGVAIVADMPVFAGYFHLDWPGVAGFALFGFIALLASLIAFPSRPQAGLLFLVTSTGNEWMSCRVATSGTFCCKPVIRSIDSGVRGDFIIVHRPRAVLASHIPGRLATRRIRTFDATQAHPLGCFSRCISLRDMHSRGIVRVALS
jgi:hypothetical protein